MKVLVTGGNGFLGSSVVAGLAAAGHEVVSADLTVPEGGLDKLDHRAALDHRGALDQWDAVDRPVTYVVADVTDRGAVSAAVKEAQPEVVVHLAAIVTPGRKSNRELEHKVDVEGSRNVFDACVEHGVRRVVVSSSGAAYGYHADNPEWITEDQPVRGNPEFAYSDHKRQVEAMLGELRKTHPELEQVVLRIGTILGERVDNQITALFERRRLLKIKGSKSPFVFVWDTDVTAIIERAVTGEATGIFNVAGDGALTVDEIAARLGKKVRTLPEPALRRALAVGKRLGVTAYGPEQTRFLEFRPVLDNTRLKEVFGYVPAYTSAEAFEAWRNRPAAAAAEQA